jgi:hypothetical protein
VLKQRKQLGVRESWIAKSRCVRRVNQGQFLCA